MLADGVISSEEYRMVTDQVVACAAAHGEKIWAEDRWGISVYAADKDVGRTLDECEADDLGAIRSRYENWYRDPDGQGDGVFIACFHRVGLIGSLSGATVDDVLSAPATPQREAEIDRCMYDPTGRTWSGD